MKRILSLAAMLLCSMAALAQSPEEIIARMDEAMSAHEKDGMIMTLEMKMPIIGTMSTTSYIKGDKMRMEMEPMGKKVISWSDGVTSWTYNVESNEIEITKKKATEESSSSGKDEADMLSGITEGYDVSLQKETSEAWYIICKKSKSNKEKDDPKRMDLVVLKKNYYPKSLSAKMSGVTVTIRDVDYGVTEEQVTFNPADYPDAKIVDKR